MWLPFLSSSRTRSVAQSESVEAHCCSWGEDHAFDHAHNSAYEGDELVNSDSNISVPTTVPEEEVTPLIEALKRQCSGCWSAKGTDDGMSTISTAVGLTPSTPGNTSASTTTFTETLRSDSSGFSTKESASHVMKFAKSCDWRFAQVYERRMQAIVKAEQRKAMKRAS
jgi:hypothetical protein